MPGNAGKNGRYQAAISIYQAVKQAHVVAAANNEVDGVSAEATTKKLADVAGFDG